MSFISIIFHTFFYKPLFNLLIFIYNVIPGHDFGIAIIILTVLIRFVLYPLTRKGIESQKAMALIQPKLKEAQEKHKHDRAKQAEEMMRLYREYKVNPFSGFLNLLVQIPILIALYKVFMAGVDPKSLDGLYGFVKNPGAIDPMFLGIMDLSQANPVMAVIAGALQFLQSKMMLPKLSRNQNQKQSDFAKIMQNQMLYILPFLTIMIAWKFPAGLPLYWIVTTLFSIGQQYYMEHWKTEGKKQTSETQLDSHKL